MQVSILCILTHTPDLKTITFEKEYDAIQFLSNGNVIVYVKDAIMVEGDNVNFTEDELDEEIDKRTRVMYEKSCEYSINN